MTQLLWLDPDDEFPNPDHALTDPNGLLAVGADLSPNRLLAAYRRGIFPWYDDDQPILWWSPDPRCVITPKDFVPSKSLVKRLRRQEFEVIADHNFEGVIDACQHRGGGESTWITEDMKAAYLQLHQLGHAHSVECYSQGELVGGLYGIAIGKLFFGESMFHRVTDASKVAFSTLMSWLTDAGSPLVDCQVTNAHLLSLGAYEIPRTEFLKVVSNHVDDEPLPWSTWAR